MRRLLPILAPVAVAIGAFAYLYARVWQPSTVDYPVQGLRVSAADGAVDWPAVRAAGADFAFVVATDGTARDSAFERNWAGAHGVGLRHGAVHRFSLCASSADQVGAYVTTVPREVDALPAALLLDFDPRCAARPDRAQVMVAVRAFLDGAERRDGRRMLLAPSPAFERAYAVSEAIARPLWAERRFFAPTYLARPWRLWQASDLRRIDGVAGPVAWSVVAP